MKKKYIFENCSVYKILSKYDQDITLYFGSIKLDINLINIDLIPCFAIYNEVKIINNSNNNLNIDFEIIKDDNIINEFNINNISIIVREGVYFLK